MFQEMPGGVAGLAAEHLRSQDSIFELQGCTSVRSLSQHSTFTGNAGRFDFPLELTAGGQDIQPSGFSNKH